MKRLICSIYHDDEINEYTLVERGNKIRHMYTKYPVIVTNEFDHTPENKIQMEFVE